GSLLGLGGVGREARYELLQFGNLGFLLGVLALLAFTRLGAGDHKVVVGARVDLDIAVVDIGHVGADRVQEVTIVRDDDHRALHVSDDVFQPTEGVDIKVVGRFVEQQDVRVGKQRLRQQYPKFPAGCDFAHRAVVRFTGNTGAQLQFAGTGFSGVAIQLGKFAFQVGGAHVIVFGCFRVGVNGITLLLDHPQFFVAHQHGVDHGEF